MVCESPVLPCRGAGGGGMAGGTVHACKPLLVALAQRSSEGLVKELFIWLHSALMLSASPATDKSISGTGEKRSMEGVNSTNQNYADRPYRGHTI